MAGHVGTAYTYTIVAKNDGGRSSTSVTSSNSATPRPGNPSAGASGNDTTRVVTYTWGSAASTEPVTYTISGSGIATHAVAASGSETITGSYGSSYSFTVTATSAGLSTSKTSNSVTLTNPYAIHLCYGGALGGGNSLGVSWVGNATSHHITFSGYQSTIDFSAGSGSATSGAWTARNTAGDLNTQITWSDNGTSHTTRWGDAPAC